MTFQKQAFGIAATAVALVMGTGVAVSTAEAQQAKNVIVMISDGASFGTWDAASLYEYGTTTAPSYYGPEFAKYLMTTYALNTSNTPTGDPTPQVGYDPAKAWGLASYTNGSNSYLHQNAVDSAAAGTAISAGVKTYNNAINWGNDNLPVIPTLPELAKQHGKVVGTISSVQWSHATPAAFSNAHNVSRNDYLGISQEMLNGNVMDVIMGAGHPQFNNNGVQTIANYADVSDSQAKYVGGKSNWIALNEGTHAGGWQSIQTKAEFELLSDATNVPTVLGSKRRLVGTAQVASTLQQSRSGYAHTDTVGSDPMNTNVPTLLTMTKGALNTLSYLDTGNGMFLQIEGGAVDWAAHGNQTSRIIEEQIDFNRSVEYVINWIEAHGGWDNNLLIVTTDHGNSMPSGPDSGTAAHDRIELGDLANGTWTTTKPTGVRWWSGSHTNELVPLFVRGAGAHLFNQYAINTDPNFVNYYTDWAQKGFDGRYVDNTNIFQVASAVIPEPATFGILSIGAGTMVLRRRSR